MRSLVRDLLAAAPHLVILLTSRQSLGSDREHVLELGSLPHDAKAVEALALFTARAREADPSQAPPWGRNGSRPPGPSAPASKESPSRWNSPPRS